MSHVKRTIRKTHPNRPAAFDEQFWPVVIALLVLGGFLFGITLAYRDQLSDRNLFWASVILLPIALGLLITAMGFVSNKFLRRSMQLSVVVSVIIHIAVLVGSLESTIFARHKRVADDFTESVRPPRVVSMPDYTRLRRRPDDKFDYQRIVETTTPEPPNREEIEKDDPDEERHIRALIPTVTAEPERTVQLSVTSKQELTRTAPRHSEDQSRLSRQLANTAPTTAAAADPLQQRQEPMRRARSDLVENRREEARENSLQRNVQLEPSAPSSESSANVGQRRTQPIDQPQPAIAPMLRRRVGESRVTPRTSVDSEQSPSVPRRTDLATDSAPISASTKASGPDADRPTRNDPQSLALETARATRRGERTERQPTFSKTPLPVPTRQVRSTQRPSVVQFEENLATVSQADRLSPTQPGPRRELTSQRRQPDLANNDVATTRRVTSRVAPQLTAMADVRKETTTQKNRPLAERGPAGTDVERQPVASTPDTQSRPALNIEAASPSTEVAGALRPRAQVAPTPSMLPRSAINRNPARAVALANVASSPRAVENPSAARSEHGTSNSSLEPAQLALSKSLSGIAGQGDSPNLDQASLSSKSPALTASNSAKRAQSLQNTPLGSALLPSQTAILKRTVVDQHTATASASAREVELAKRSGERQPTAMDASASAALTTARAEIHRGQVTASKGTVDVDLGPPRIVSHNATGRASGGGARELNFETDGQKLARANTGGAPDRSLAAIQLDKLLAREADGGGSPPVPLDPDATAVTHAVSGGEQQVTGGPATLAEVGPFSKSTGATRPPMSALRSAEKAMAYLDAGGERIGQSRPGRAEPVEAAPGRRPAIGGGTESPFASRSKQTTVASTESDEAATAGFVQSSGHRDVRAYDAQGLELTRRSGGAAGPFVRGPVGATDGPTIVAAESHVLPGSKLARREASASNDIGLAAAGEGPVAAPLKKSLTAALPSGVRLKPIVDIPTVENGANDRPSTTNQLATNAVGPVLRSSNGGLPVRLQVPDGPGGLHQRFEPDVGISNRRARDDSRIVQPIVASRFKRSDPGGTVATNDSAIVPAEAFRGRQRDQRDTSGSGRYGPQTERAIELGLMFLERHQASNGNWSFHNFGAGQPGYEQERDVILSSDTAATGLALLAFQGAGYDHRQYKYADVVRRAIDWLIENQQDDGDLFARMDEVSNRSTWLYSHSIATIALCEAFGMTQDPYLREPAQKAIDFIVAAQDKQLGGWRYSPERGADTSVTGWMMMALYSGDLANLDVPADTYGRIRRWLDSAQASDEQRHLYCYNPYAPDTDQQRHGRQATKTMTAVGLVMRLYSGWQRDNPHMVDGAEYLLQHLPAYGVSRDVRDPNHERDTYYWYYATQVMIHMGGKYWKDWEARLHPLLIRTQTQRGAMAGSWNPRGTIPDKWGLHSGRLYVTSMNLLSLEVQYRKLPLYDETAK